MFLFLSNEGIYEKLTCVFSSRLSDFRYDPVGKISIVEFQCKVFWKKFTANLCNLYNKSLQSIRINVNLLVSIF